MFDPREYREACRELRAPEKKIEEIIAMTEQRTHKRRFRALGTGLAVCAAAATMVVGVAAANPEAAQEFFAHITSVVTVGEFRRDLTTEEGEQVTVLELPQATVETGRDGPSWWWTERRPTSQISWRARAAIPVRRPLTGRRWPSRWREAPRSGR